MLIYINFSVNIYTISYIKKKGFKIMALFKKLNTPMFIKVTDSAQRQLNQLKSIRTCSIKTKAPKPDTLS